MTRKPSGKRPYLSRDDRRASLLDAAAELVEKSGWNALTMVSLAQQAQVSRQLIYQHFPSAEQLMAGTLEHLFQDVYQQTIKVVSREQPADYIQRVELMQRITLDISPGRARALWQAMSIGAGGDSEMATLSRKLRHLLVKMTRELAEQTLGVSAAQARLLSWMLIVAFWGGRQFMDDGEISQAELIRMHGWLAERVMLGIQTPPPTVTGKGDA